MRRVFWVVLLVAVGAGCAGERAPEEAGAGGVTSSSGASASSVAVVAPGWPGVEGEAKCPYLSSGDVAQFNGQQVGKVKVGGGGPWPACFFYRPNGEEQLRVRVYQGSEAEAKALVDAEAPVATSSPVTLDGGWTGGAQPTEKGAVFAVARGGTAVVAVSNQKRTIAPKRVVEKVVEAVR